MPVPDTLTAEAGALMLAYARRTGLDSDRPPVRYLWTDAYAVCNMLGLADATGEPRYRELALKLVRQVHHVLGRHRDDDPRKGWISGLGVKAGEDHPVMGGLRIGKPLPERGSGDPYDERLEWDRDGQYFHYLTKWMYALDQVSRKTGDPAYNLWARELAATAARAFTYQPSPRGTPRMYWKMSIDLTRPQVTAMGQQDPLDGYVTALQLDATVPASPQAAAGTRLDAVIDRYAAMTATLDLGSSDPLGIGGLLVDAWRLLQLKSQDRRYDPALIGRILEAATMGLEQYARGRELRAPAEFRLAFRELGLAIGLHALEQMREALDSGRITVTGRIREQLEALNIYLPLSERIESFWRAPDQQRSETWIEHRDINEVMLATSLRPEGFLTLATGRN